MRLIAPLLLLLLLMFVGGASGTITGDAPNAAGDTIIDENTTWTDEPNIQCGGNIVVGNASQRIWFNITNSTVTAIGKWTMGGDTPVNFTLDDSTIQWTVISGNAADQPVGAIVNFTQMIFIDDTADQINASRFEFRDSVVSGTNYSYLAGGITVESGGLDNLCAKHTVIVDGMNFTYMGGADFSVGGAYAISVRGWETGSDLAQDSSLKNSTIYYCGRGIDMCSNIGADNITAYDGYVAFHKGKDWNHLTMHKTFEGVYNPADYAWIRNSWFDGGGTKFDIMNAEHTIFEYNTVINASINAGAIIGGENNTLQHNTITNCGTQSTTNDTKLINNSITGTDMTYAIMVYGCENFLIDGNNLDDVTVGIRMWPHSAYYTRGYDHIIENNIITNSGYGMQIEKQGNATFINNTINKTKTGWAFFLDDCDDSIFRDNTIIDTITYDIYFNGDNSNNKFVNTYFDENKINFVDSSDIFNSYYYLDVRVVDSGGNPIDGVTITTTNNIDAKYYSINVSGDNKTSFTTGVDGHTPLPIGNESNSVAIMDYWKNTSTYVNMNYTVSASKTGYTDNSTAVNATSAWYRSTPNTYQNTTTIILGGWIPSNQGNYYNTTNPIVITRNATMNIFSRTPTELDKNATSGGIVVKTT